MDDMGDLLTATSIVLATIVGAATIYFQARASRRQHTLEVMLKLFVGPDNSKVQRQLTNHAIK